LPLGDAHFKDFLSRVKRLGEKKQYFFILVKNHTALLKKQHLSHITWNLSADVIVLGLVVR
jgi:hypothetical protein